MTRDWTNPVVVDHGELRKLADEAAALRSLRRRHRGMVAVFVLATIATAATLYGQASRLSAKTDEARQYRRLSRRADAALTALARSHDRILAATEQSPSVGTKSWGRRFTVTKYIPRSPAYGKSNDGLTATMTKADPESRIIAVDPTLIPYGSWVWIEDMGWYRAEDCGSAIKGFRLDILTATEDDAMRFGRQDRFVIVVPNEPTVG